MNDSPHKLDLTTVETDAEIAKGVRAELAPLITQIVEIMNRAKDRGMIISFNIPQDQYGRYFAQPVSLVKPL